MEETSPKESSRGSRVYVILNPVAGMTDPDATVELVNHYCEKHSWECEIYKTQKDEDLRQLVKDALHKGVDMVIAAGGDGTVSSVVSGMVNSHVPLGIIPAGTGNALARDLSIPLDFPSALNLLGSEHKIQELDVMDVEGKGIFVMNVSVGVSSLTMRKTAREEKRKYGFLAYLYRAADTLMRSDLHRFVVKVDNRPMQFSASEVLIANNKLAGLQPQLDGVEIDPEDGKMDMFVVSAQSLRDYLDVFSKFVAPGKVEDASNLYYLSARNTIRIESEFPLPVQADGEELGTTPVEVKLIPRGLKVIVPVNVPPDNQE